MTRLYNHTRYDDAVLRDVLNWAVRAVGVKGDVPVKVNYCIHLRGSGVAHRGFPYLKTLKGRPTTSRDKRTLNCPCGWVEVALPRRRRGWLDHSSLDAAEWFVHLALHEMAHIVDYRQPHTARPDGYWGHQLGTRRRIAHDRRPCELFAQNLADAAVEKTGRERQRQELVIALAIALETEVTT